MCCPRAAWKLGEGQDYLNCLPELEFHACCSCSAAVKPVASIGKARGFREVHFFFLSEGDWPAISFYEVKRIPRRCACVQTADGFMASSGARQPARLRRGREHDSSSPQALVAGGRPRQR